MIRLGTVAWLVLQNALWRVTGLRAAGRGLLRGLESPDPNVRTIAGMLLVRAGARAEPLLREAVATGRSVPLVATIMGDIGDRRLEPVLVGLAADRNPEIARAARDALRALEANAAASRR